MIDSINAQKIDLKIPEYVWWVSGKLAKAGSEAHLVGGSVRDLIAGREPKDYDLATDASPKKVQEIFPNSIAVGAAFGIITVLAPDKKGENFPVEVATYRIEQDYVDGRWPSKVKFTDDITKDLGRRDFTVNAMAYPLHADKNKREIIDPFGGIDDLKKKLVRAVGDSVERLKEDGLRGFRACRMASNWGFALDSDLKSAIKKNTAVAKQISVERIRDEFLKLLYNSPKPSVGIELMRETGLLEIFMPELLEGIKVKQEKAHVHNVYEHLLFTVDKAIDEVKLAALFHDIGKPSCQTDDGHFYGHELKGARITQEIMSRMKFPKAEIKKVTILVRNHMFWYHEEWTDAAVRRLIRRVGGEGMLELLLALRMADSQSNPKAELKPWVVRKLQARVAKIKKEEMVLKVSDLALGGNEVIKLGVPKNIRVRTILDYLLDKVIDDPSLNTKEHLEKEVKKFVKNNCQLLWFVDKNDIPVEQGKGYLEDAKKNGLCYRAVEVQAIDSEGKKQSLFANCFPEEGYKKAAKRIVWEKMGAQTLTNLIKKSGHVKEKGEDGVCKFVTQFIFSNKVVSQQDISE